MQVYICTVSLYIDLYIHIYTLSSKNYFCQQRKCFIKIKTKLYFYNECVYFYLEFNKEDSNPRVKFFNKITKLPYCKNLARKNYIAGTLQTNQTSI